MRKLEGFQKGVNLGGWLSQGSKEKSHLDNFILEEDIKRIKKMGCDHLRLPVDYENIEDENGVPKESGYNYIETCILWCQKNGLNVVLDLHKTPGYIFDNPEYSNGFFENPKLQERFLNIWDRFSKRFAKYSSMMMFEMLNEVTSYNYIDVWNDLALKCIKVIRKNCPTVKILYGGVGYSATDAVKYLLPPYDENIVYNVHCYEPMVFTHQGAYWVFGMPTDFRIDYPGNKDDYVKYTNMIEALKNGKVGYDGESLLKLDGKEFFLTIFKEAKDYALKYNVPLYCGEYGVIDLADLESTLNWIKDINYCFKEYGIGRAIWNYKEKDFGIIGKHYSPIYDEFIKYL